MRLIINYEITDKLSGKTAKRKVSFNKLAKNASDEKLKEFAEGYLMLIDADKTQVQKQIIVDL